MARQPDTTPRQPGEYSSELPQNTIHDIERREGKDFSQPDPAVAKHKEARGKPTQPPSQPKD